MLVNLPNRVGDFHCGIDSAVLMLVKIFNDFDCRVLVLHRSLEPMMSSESPDYYSQFSPVSEQTGV